MFVCSWKKIWKERIENRFRVFQKEKLHKKLLLSFAREKHMDIYGFPFITSARSGEVPVFSANEGKRKVFLQPERKNVMKNGKVRPLREFPVDLSSLPGNPFFRKKVSSISSLFANWFHYIRQKRRWRRNSVDFCELIPQPELENHVIIKLWILPSSSIQFNCRPENAHQSSSAMLHVRSYSVRAKRRNMEAASSFRRNQARRKLGVTLSNTSTVSQDSRASLAARRAAAATTAATAKSKSSSCLVENTSGEDVGVTVSPSKLPVRKFDSMVSASETMVSGGGGDEPTKVLLVLNDNHERSSSALATPTLNNTSAMIQANVRLSPSPPTPTNSQVKFE